MDAALIWDGTGGDLAVLNNDLYKDNGLATAVIVSLCSDGRAAFSDELPAGVTERRGWWAVDQTGWGSLLWLISREKTTTQTAARAKQYAEKALQWLIDDGVAKTVTVVAEIVNRGTIGLHITITRGTNRKYDYLWKAMENSDGQTYRQSLNVPTGLV